MSKLLVGVAGALALAAVAVFSVSAGGQAEKVDPQDPRIIWDEPAPVITAPQAAVADAAGCPTGTVPDAGLGGACNLPAVAAANARTQADVDARRKADAQAQAVEQAVYEGTTRAIEDARDN